LIILEKKVVGLSPEALGRFVLRARRAARLTGRVNVLVTDNTQMRSLNQQFRKKNETTDVLSFPSESTPNGNSKRAFAGEIAISTEIAVQNAAELGHASATEVKILALHGILHLAGYDHERDNGEMARKEATLRRELGLPSSLTERVGAGRRGAVKSVTGSDRTKARRTR
jgi:probable rRNA maturation factor